MEVAAGLIKLNPDSDSKVDEWRDTMERRMDEALATLVHEGAQIESWFRVEIGGEDYLLWYMRAESMKKVFEVSQTFKHPIDKYHYGLMASITAPKGNIVAKPLLDLKV
jgi:uncharacterized protein DUF6176